MFGQLAILGALVLASIAGGGVSFPIWVYPAAAAGAFVGALAIARVFVEPEQFASARAMKRYREEHGIPRGGSPADATR